MVKTVNLYKNYKIYRKKQNKIFNKTTINIKMYF